MGKNTATKLGVIGLASIVISSMVGGGGVFPPSKHGSQRFCSRRALGVGDYRLWDVFYRQHV